MNKINILRLKDMVFFAHHGCYQDERRRDQKLAVDVELFYRCQGAIRADDLNQTVDYSRVYGEIKAVMNGDPLNLLETLAEKIAGRILSNFRVEKVVVRVKKPHPPLPGLLDGVECEIERYSVSESSGAD
ncbi:dihydroneopterin aldolase [candidate division KSB1 bacterium]|nr:dihydroneopterin aldolase [candidate division KSB1 bacterium]